MPEVITLSDKEASGVISGIAPEAFRFAKVDDFHNNGVRHDYVKMYIYQQGKVCQLAEYSFGYHTDKGWLQWLLQNGRVFIKTGNRVGIKTVLNYFVEPTYEFMNLIEA